MREDEHLGSCVSLAILMERALLREIERTWRAYKWGFQQRQAARMRLPVWLALLMPPAKTHGRNPSRARAKSRPSSSLHFIGRPKGEPAAPLIHVA
jgi:hypothetical protein